MTLSTNVYVLDEVDPREVFRFCQGMLTKYDEDGGHRTPDQQVWSDKAASVWHSGTRSEATDGRRWIANRLGQGLPGILHVDYRVDGPLRTAEQQATHDEDCDEDCTGKYHAQACWLDIDFDTAYSYRDVRGWGCGDLHAVLVAELGKWLDGKGVRWEWRNEFTSEVHGGDDRYARLIDLVSGGVEATAWFRTTVMPAIAADILNNGGGAQ